MFTTRNTIKEVAEHPLMREIFPIFLAKEDLTVHPCYNVSMEEFQKMGGWNAESVCKGFNRVLAQREKGNAFYRLYSGEEIAADPAKKDVSLMWFPSDDPKAAERPYVLICSGGAYHNVWNLTEGFPVAARFNKRGYNAFALTYRTMEKALLPKPLDDYAKALTFIRDNESLFGVKWDHYLTTGFSAGSNLIMCWGSDNHGYSTYGMPKPAAMFPIYGHVSWKFWYEAAKLVEGGVEHLSEYSNDALGMTLAEAAESSWNIEEHVDSFPPCYIACTEDDELVHPEHSRILKRALDAKGIPAVLEIGKYGKHGFGEGLGADTDGWIERAADFYESL